MKAKLYKSVKTGELVAANSCEECPHKGTITTSWGSLLDVCTALNWRRDPFDPSKGHYHPGTLEAWEQWCPLPDAAEVEHEGV